MVIFFPIFYFIFTVKTTRLEALFWKKMQRMNTFMQTVQIMDRFIDLGNKKHWISPQAKFLQVPSATGLIRKALGGWALLFLEIFLTVLNLEDLCPISMRILGPIQLCHGHLWALRNQRENPKMREWDVNCGWNERTRAQPEILSVFRIFQGELPCSLMCVDPSSWPGKHPEVAVPFLPSTSGEERRS